MQFFGVFRPFLQRSLDRLLPFRTVAFLGCCLSGRCLFGPLPFWAVAFLGRCLFGPLPFWAVAFWVIASGGLNRSFIIHFSLGDHRSQITQFCGHEPVCRQFSNPIGCKTFKSWTFQPKDIIRNHSNPGFFNPGFFNPGLFNPGLFNPGLFNPELFNSKI